MSSLIREILSYEVKNLLFQFFWHSTQHLGNCSYLGPQPFVSSSFSSLFPLVEPFSTHVMFSTEKNNWDLFLIRFLKYLSSHLIKKFLLAHTRTPFCCCFSIGGSGWCQREEIIHTITNDHLPL